MQLNKLFFIKPKNQLVKLSISHESRTPSVHLICGNKQVIFLVHSPEYTEEFYENISEPWIEFVLESSNRLLLDDNKIMSEYVLNLN